MSDPVRLYGDDDLADPVEAKPMAVVDTPHDAGLSVLGDLRSRRERIVEQQVLTLPVPRWENPRIVVKYRPMPHRMFRRVEEEVEKAPKKDKAEVEVQLNADVLINACIGVVAILDGQEYSLRPGDPTGEPTTFDHDLAANLGLPEKLNRKPTARETVRELFITEADIIAQAAKLADFSGYKNQEADDSIAGES